MAGILSNSFYFLDEIVHKILSNHAEFAPDRCIWGMTHNGKFSVSFAYLSIFNDSDEWRWKFIRNMHKPSKTKSVLWTMLHGKIVTNLQRWKRKIPLFLSAQGVKWMMNPLTTYLGGVRSHTDLGFWGSLDMISHSPALFPSVLKIGCLLLEVPGPGPLIQLHGPLPSLLVFGLFGSGGVNWPRLITSTGSKMLLLTG